LHSNEEPEKSSRTIQSAFYDWFSPSQYLVIKSESILKSTTKRLRANRRHFFKPDSHFHRPPRHIQIYLCAYLDLESNECLHTRWTGKPNDMSIRPLKCIDKTAKKPFDRRGKCKWCGSNRVVKAGKNNGKQLYKCNDCKHRFHDNGKFPRMRKPKEAVAFALEMYFDGHSIRKISKNLKKFFGVEVHWRKILEWIEKYVPQVDNYLSQFEPQLSGVWHADEKAVNFRPRIPLTDKQRRSGKRRKGQQHWHWDAIDKETRFLVGSHISRTRTLEDAKTFMKDCARNTPRPTAIVTDGLEAYRKGINKVFYSRYKHRRVEHIPTEAIPRTHIRIHNQLIERWHGTLGDRLKPMRGLVSPETAIPRGFGIHYNFLRPHESLDGNTPAEEAQVQLPFENGWGDLINWTTIWQSLCQTKEENQKMLNLNPT